MATSLLRQNPWLRDAERRAEAMRVSAASSSAVEGIRKPFEDKTPIKSPRKAVKSGG